jgi:hypothetical protein
MTPHNACTGVVDRFENILFLAVALSVVATVLLTRNSGLRAARIGVRAAVKDPEDLPSAADLAFLRRYEIAQTAINLTCFGCTLAALLVRPICGAVSHPATAILVSCGLGLATMLAVAPRYHRWMTRLP